MKGIPGMLEFDTLIPLNHPNSPLCHKNPNKEFSTSRSYLLLCLKVKRRNRSSTRPNQRETKQES